MGGEQGEGAAGQKGAAQQQQNRIHLKPENEVEGGAEGAEGAAEGGYKVQKAGHLAALILRLHEKAHGVGGDHAQHHRGQEEEGHGGEEGAVAGILHLRKDRLHEAVPKAVEGPEEQGAAMFQ